MPAVAEETLIGNLTAFNCFEWNSSNHLLPFLPRLLSSRKILAASIPFATIL
jgi:hypothetical protein